MTVETLFGQEQVSTKPRSIRFKQIKDVYETLTVKDGITGYFTSYNKYTSPAQIHENFSFLRQEAKEYFLALHLDGKNRILCIDQVSVGSLNQSIVHSSIQVTERYAHLAPHKLAHAAKMLED
jgi:DNA repair protein RadC